MAETVTVYFDYLCPFAWRAAELAEVVAQELGVAFTWRHFSLYQNNYQGTSNWQLWNDPVDFDDDSGGKGLLPFLASCAARRQGRAAHDAFRLTTLRARHRECRPLTLKTVFAAAEVAGLHLPSFEQDLGNPESRTLLAKEHHQATSLDVFGTPTFHFPSGHLAYFRIGKLPASPREAVDLFVNYQHLLEAYPYLETIKRPRPKGN